MLLSSLTSFPTELDALAHVATSAGFTVDSRHRIHLTVSKDALKGASLSFACPAAIRYVKPFNVLAVEAVKLSNGAGNSRVLIRDGEIDLDRLASRVPFMHSRAVAQEQAWRARREVADTVRRELARVGAEVQDLGLPVSLGYDGHLMISLEHAPTLIARLHEAEQYRRLRQFHRV